MGKLGLQVLAAAVLAGLLFWGERGGGALAASVRRLAGTYIQEQSALPAALAPKATRKGAAAAVRRARYGWPLVGAVRTHPGGGIEILAPGGAIVRAAASGRVISVSAYAPGVAVTVAGPGGTTWRYLHLGPSDVHRGEAVQLGGVLGAVSHFPPGGTAHLTLEAFHGQKPLGLPGVLGSP